MKHFKLWNNLLGWVSFAIAAATYLLTMEPTASFWDCGEFISSAFKLDVGHPPGAPFFMLTGRFFTLFASDPTKVAMMINALSALCSAFTILFLFWTITRLGRMLLDKSDDALSLGQAIALLGAGMVGALAYTFSDTFWFSAVEGEVYAYSSLFTAVVFWSILKWHEQAEDAGSDRWLILIAYLMGLSIGVHLLNLLAIPAIVMVYYYRNFKATWKGVLYAFLASAVILGTILYGMIPGFVEVACWFELLFVNTFHLPFNTGVLVYICLAVAALIWAIWETATAKNYWRMIVSFIVAVTAVGIPFFKESVIIGICVIALLGGFFYWKRELVSARWLNTTLMMITVMLIGYSSYAVIVIRSSAEPPMDQNSPDNVFALKAYLNREQYGDRPLIYGAVYNAPVKRVPDGMYCVPETKQGKAQYAPKPKTTENENDEYVVTGYKTTYVTDEKFNMLFPRMYSSQESHVKAYKEWANIKGTKVSYETCGQRHTAVKPTFGENLRFFFTYQCNFMYWRYFMWNFSGRQNDLQSHGELDKGNWITGIGFIDNAMLGDQSKLPDSLADNKGHNRYYLLPLLLGIIGIVFQLTRGKKGEQNFFITFLLFFLTGLAIVVYLNQTPYQPRERDYAYAGSFYAFCIWIGLGVLGVSKALDKFIPKSLAALIASVACLGVPALMASENWDDHDRSDRYVARDFGANYLTSCADNAIIFCNGDNDTFPLWYNQEVEGYRTDVRSCNLSYLNTDWYIDQMKRPYYESEALPISWTKKDYMVGKNDYVMVDNRLDMELSLQSAYDFLLSTDPRTKFDNGDAYIPSTKVFIPVNAEEVAESPIFGDTTRYNPAAYAKRMDLKMKRGMTKSDLMVMEMLQTNQWKRPMYFAVTVGNDYYLGLEKYFELTGLAYRVTPIASRNGQPRVNTEIMYDNLMNKFRYGNVSSEEVYLDENTLRMCGTHRMMFAQLANALIMEGDKEKALKVVDYSFEVLPGTTVRHDYYSTLLAESYYLLNEADKADAIMRNVATDCVQYLYWIASLAPTKASVMKHQQGQKLAMLNHVLSICNQYQRYDILKEYEEDFMRFAEPRGRK